MAFEDEHYDVLQNIESGIVSVYRQHPEMVDWDVETALGTLIQHYNMRGKPGEMRNLPGVQGEVVNAVKAMCDWRLGRSQPIDENDQPIDSGMVPTTPEEIVACLKRIRKSVQFWTKKSGRQGYLKYIIDFVP